jgi:hypothetical protein
MFDADQLKSIIKKLEPEEKELVKNAVLIDGDLLTKLDETDFAYPEKMMFPVVDSGNVILSRELFLSNPQQVEPEQISKVASALIEAHERFNLDIPDELKELTNYSPPKPDIFEGETFPVTKQEIQKTASKMASKIQQFPIELRRKFAVNLVKEAEKFDSEDDLPDLIKDYAGNDVNPELITSLETRYALAKQAGLDKEAEGYMLIAEFVDEHPEELNSSKLEEIANLIHNLDRRFGLDRFYDEHIPDPFRSVFCREGLLSKYHEEKKDIEDALSRLPLKKGFIAIATNDANALKSIPPKIRQLLEEGEYEDLDEAEDLDEEVENEAEDEESVDESFQEFLESGECDDLIDKDTKKELLKNPDLVFELPLIQKLKILKRFEKFLKD